jgi:hypothetical protein
LWGARGVIHPATDQHPATLIKTRNGGRRSHDSGLITTTHAAKSDPLVVLSFDAPRERGAFLNPYAVVQARAAVQLSDDAWDLLNRLAKVYVGPDVEFPAPKVPGEILRYSIERVGGVGPWAST